MLLAVVVCGLPGIRNQQVGGSSPLAGTRKSMSYLVFRFVQAVRVDFWVDFFAQSGFRFVIRNQQVGGSSPLAGTIKSIVY